MFHTKIPYPFLRQSIFFTFLVLLLIEINYFNNSYRTSFSALRLVTIILYLFSSSFSLRKRDDDKNFFDLAKDFNVWLYSHEQRDRRLQTGYSLVTSSTVLFILHLLFNTYYEPSMWTGEGTNLLGWETTFATFLGIIIIPFLAILSIVNGVDIDKESVFLFLHLWAMAIIFSIGNIMLLSAYFARHKLESKIHRKRYIIVIVSCIIYSFFSPGMETFYFGHALWVISLFSLLTGLLIIEKNTNM